MNNDSVTPNQFSAKKIVPASYSKQKIAIYEGNKYIESLPDPYDSYDAFFKRMTHLPEMTDEIRSLPNERKVHFESFMDTFYLPSSLHFHIQRHVDMMIRQGYVALAKHEDNTCRSAPDEKYGIQAEQNTTTHTLMVTGLSGCGKTKLIAKVLSRYPKVILHTTHNGKDCFEYQIPYLKVEIPPAADIKNLCISINQAIDDLFPSSNSLSNNAGKISAKRQIEYIDKQLKLHHVGLLVIDEIQNIKHLSATASNTMMDFLLQLQNVISTPMVLIGTPDAEKMLSGTLKNSRRIANTFHVCPYENNSTWTTFVKAMIHLSYTKTAYTEELADYMYTASCGIPGVAILLFKQAQLRAVLTNAPGVTTKILRAVEKDSLSPLKKMLNAIRTSDISTLMSVPDIPNDTLFTVPAVLAKKEHSAKENSPLSPESIEIIHKKERIEAKIHALGMAHSICKESVGNIFQGPNIFKPESELVKMAADEAIRLFQDQSAFGSRMELVNSRSALKKKSERAAHIDEVKNKYGTDFLDPAGE